MDQAIARRLAASRRRSDRSAELVRRRPSTSVDDRQQDKQSLVDSSVDLPHSPVVETRQANNGRVHTDDHAELLASEVSRLAAISQQDECTTIPTLYSSGARVKCLFEIHEVVGRVR